MEDQRTIYSIFRSLIRIAALSSPSTTAIKNHWQRERILAFFGSPQRSRKFNYVLSKLELKQLDDELEIVRI